MHAPHGVLEEQGCPSFLGSSSELTALPAGRRSRLRRGGILSRTIQKPPFASVEPRRSVPPAPPKGKARSTPPELKHTYISFQLSPSVFVQELLPFPPERLLLWTEEKASVTARSLLTLSSTARTQARPASQDHFKTPEEWCRFCFIPPPDTLEIPCLNLTLHEKLGMSAFLWAGRPSCSAESGRGTRPSLRALALVKPLGASSPSPPFYFLTPVLTEAG